jgi:hypothetical protein
VCEQWGFLDQREWKDETFLRCCGGSDSKRVSDARERVCQSGVVDDVDRKQTGRFGERKRE